MKKNIITIICIILVIVTIYYLRGLSTRKEEAKIKEMDTQGQILDEKNREIINNLINKYGAKEYKNDNYNPTILSLQNSLLNSNPVIFTSFGVDDVYSKDNKYYIKGTPYDTYNDYIIEMECSKIIAESINQTLLDMDNYDSKILNQFIIVLNILNVDKEQNGIEDVFILKGQCLDAVNY